MEIILKPGTLDFITTIFSSLGALSLIWIVWRELKSFLEITVSSSGSRIVTSIFNKSFFKRGIQFAAIILTRPNSKVIEEMKELFPTKNLEYTNDFVFLKEKIIGKKSAFIPLDFYNFENVRIADEKLTYSIDLTNYDITLGIYEVRFFVFPKSRYRLHRTTQCLATKSNQ